MPKEKSLKVVEIPVDKRNKHPPPPNDILPKHEFTLGIIAPKGAGKTTLICNLLNFYKGYFHSIIIFSPTIKNDDKWDWVKEQPLLVENVRLIKLMKKLEQIDQFKDNPIVGNVVASLPLPTYKGKEKFDPRIPEEFFYDEYDQDLLENLLMEQDKMITFLKENGYSKHYANRILFLFDDQVGSNLFSNRRQDMFKKFNTTHRHYAASIIEVAQAYREIPKTLRTNFSCLILFEIFNDKEIDVIMEEFPMGLKKKQWLEVYNYCMDGGEFNFLFYNMQKPKPLRIMKNFDEVLFFKKE